MRGAVLIGALVALLAQAAAAQPRAGGGLAHARELYVRAEFEAATDAFEAELAAARDAATAVEAHRYLVALASILGAPDVADGHALAAVALAPDVTPPPGAPPEAAEHLDDARRATAGVRLHLEVAPGGSGMLLAALEPPIDGVVARLELRCADATDPTGDAHRVEGLPPSVALDVAGVERPYRCTASGALRSGAVLLEARYAADADEPAETPWAWIGAAAGIAAAGLVVAIVLVASTGPDGARIDDITIDP